MCIRDSDWIDWLAGQMGATTQSGVGDAVGKDREQFAHQLACLLYTSDAADERSSVDLGGRRIIKKKKT